MRLDKARELLTDELKQLDSVAADESREHADLASPDRTGTGMEENDEGLQLTEYDESDFALRTNREQRERVEAALQRIDKGTYGKCARCGREIDDERLEARPEADTCREHAE